MGWRLDKQLPATGFQGEGVLAVTLPDKTTRAWMAPDPAGSIPSIRIEAKRARLMILADGPVQEVAAPTLSAALAAVGDRFTHTDVRSIPPGWSSWSHYFGAVTELDVSENLLAAERLGLPIEIVQLDDGWQAEIGDWFDVSPRFGSLERLAARILASGRVPGIWTAPFLVGERSRCATDHPDWLVDGAVAGENWGQRLRVLDVTHPAAAVHLERLYRRLGRLGFGFHKLDFLYAGALPGNRHADCSALDAYREGLGIIRRAAEGATVLGCGAPLLPSIGFADAMRVGPDVIGEREDTWPQSIEKALSVTATRSWMHARLWVNDPDHVLARPQIPVRRRWTSHLERYGALAFSGDRLDSLDEYGLELTRRVLKPSSTEHVERLLERDEAALG